MRAGAVTGRFAVLETRRGVRVLVVSVEELAEMKKHGKLIVHAEENVFEQTLDRVLHRLKADFS